MVLAAMVLPTTGFYESTKFVKMVGAGRVVGIPVSAQVVIGVPGKRLAITFSVINIFTCGFFATC